LLDQEIVDALAGITGADRYFADLWTFLCQNMTLLRSRRAKPLKCLAVPDSTGHGRNMRWWHDRHFSSPSPPPRRAELRPQAVEACSLESPSTISTTTRACAPAGHRR